MRLSTVRLALVALVLAAPAGAVDSTLYEGVARGFPVLRDATGKKIGDGDFVQWIENDRLHVRISYSGQSRVVASR